MKLQLRQIEIKGFKPYKNVKVVRFSENTVIEGDNGQGKSSIADAICFAFIGTGTDGVEKAGGKLLNNESKDMYVMLMFEVDGEEHILTRAKKGNKAELILDTNSIEQVELMNWIKQKDLFLSIFNPVYFTAMTPKDQKELLQKYLGEISFDEVITKMGSEGQALMDDAFMVPQLYIDRKREELTETDSRENFLKGFVVGKGDIEIPEEKVFTQQDELNKLKAELETLNSKPIQLHDISVQVESHKQLTNQLSILSTRKYKLETDYVIFPEEKQLNDKKLERERMLTEHSNLKAQLEIIKTVTCPNCHTEIEAAPGMREQIGQQINEVVAKGKTVAAEILDIQDMLQKKKEERKSDDTKELEEINKQMANIQQQIQGNDISKLQAENNKYFNDLQNEKANIQQQIQGLENEKRDIDSFNRNRQQLIEQQEKDAQAVEAAKTELNTIKPLREKLNRDIERAKKFNSTKLKMQGEFIGQFLDKVNVQFQKIIKATGEVKDDFKLQYEDKDFNLLSTSERIKAGLEISNLLMNATGYVYPVFVDNAESITVIPQLETQMIAAKVKEGEVLR
ncbi:hypothetical protein QTL86_02525 [Cellulosilyticum sp. ST5]|uniref:hypothetical protein n=1 Tax=Cellulosilyticum sp. ST5 TaxID=3055805 RepID=UPI00397752CC